MPLCRAGPGPPNNNHEHARAHVEVVMKWGLGVWALLLESRGTWHLTHKKNRTDDQQQAAIERAGHAFGTNPRSWREDKLVS